MRSIKVHPFSPCFEQILIRSALCVGLFGAAWDTLALAISGSTETSPVLVAVFLKVFQDRFRHIERPREAAAALMGEVLVAAGRDCEAILKWKAVAEAEEGNYTGKDGVSLLVHMFEQFREGLFGDVEFSHVSPVVLLGLVGHNERPNTANGRNGDGTSVPPTYPLSATPPRIPFI